MNDDIKKHYQSLYHKHGRSHVSVQYSSKASQERRFEILLDITNQAESILDIGCGLGDMLPLIRQRFGEACIYHGIDFVEEFISDAKLFYKNDSKAFFKSHDIVKDPVDINVDFSVLSGIFNNKMVDNGGFIKKTLHRMWECSTRGIAFNALSTYVDYKDDGLHYQDPLELFDFCKRELSPYVSLRHDYDVKADSIPFEYTIWVYK